MIPDVKIIYGSGLREYVEQNRTFFENLPEEAFDFLAARAKNRILFKVKTQSQTDKGGIDMCKALDDIKKLGKEQGLKLGREREKETIAHNLFRRGMSADDTAQICEADIRQVLS